MVVTVVTVVTGKLEKGSEEMWSKRMTLLRSAQTASGQCDSNSCICCLIFTTNCPQFRSLHAPPFVAVCQGKSHPGPAHHHLKRFSASALKERERERARERGKERIGRELDATQSQRVAIRHKCWAPRPSASRMKSSEVLRRTLFLGTKNVWSEKIRCQTTAQSRSRAVRVCSTTCSQMAPAPCGQTHCSWE